ncbi:hypothetical protein B0H13DRAFT_1527085, partial [Mycena leptocephala]
MYLFIFRPTVRIDDGELLVHVPPIHEASFWSHDPRGRSRINEAAARNLGLPRVFMQARVGGPAWSRGDYQLLRHFHEAKGLDPASPEFTRIFEYP